MADSLMYLNLDDEENEKYVERQEKFFDQFQEVELNSFEKMFKTKQVKKEK